MLPLSFREYVSAVGKEGGLQRRYIEYLENSPFLGALDFEGVWRSARSARGLVDKEHTISLL
jgi:hypothetical protein